ncbi:hypothetical protein D5F01_LYC05674 [Larimichthys crocea]|uniref:Uncharacterized protein n=1 Tax=Larimichthys crocea TaxID=215358 RepID=A0A6G0ITU9_LARCR|nr:hypothetical protein D5F01_LYC05674 [Larimichthys crocea]
MKSLWSPDSRIWRGGLCYARLGRSESLICLALLRLLIWLEWPGTLTSGFSGVLEVTVEGDPQRQRVSDEEGVPEEVGEAVGCQAPSPSLSLVMGSSSATIKASTCSRVSDRSRLPRFLFAQTVAIWKGPRHSPFESPFKGGPQDCHTKTRQERPRSRTSRDRALPSQVPQEKEGTRPAVLPLPPGTPKTPILSQKTFTDLQLNPRVPPGERPGPAPTERCLPERARRRRKGSAMPKHHFPRTSKTPMLKSKMPPTEQKGNGTAEASAFPVHSREGVTRASRDRALPPWPLQASRLG